MCRVDEIVCDITTPREDPNLADGVLVQGGPPEDLKGPFVDVDKKSMTYKEMENPKTTCTLNSKRILL